jgi:hypothetical protein
MYIKFITCKKTRNVNTCDLVTSHVCKLSIHPMYLHRPMSQKVICSMPAVTLSSVQFSTSGELHFITFSALTDFDYNSLLCNLRSTKPILTSFLQRRPPSACTLIQFSAQFTWDLSRTKFRRNKTLISLLPFLSLLLIIQFRRYYRQRNYRQTFYRRATRRMLSAFSFHNSKRTLLQT